MTLVLWLLAALCCGQLGPVGVVALPALPEECTQDWWVDFLQVTQNICKGGKTCMNHPLINEKATGALLQALSFNGAACARGLGSAAAFVLRSISNRLKNVALVDVNLDARGEATVVLALSVWERVEELNFPLDFSFEPFPYDVRTLLPFRVRTWHALAQLYSGAGRVLTASGIPHFAWLGGMRFWSELAGALVEVHRVHEDVFPVGAEVGPEHWNRMLTLPLQEYTMDIVVPAELEEKLLSLNLDFEFHGKHHPLERLFVHSVEKGRLAQIVTNNFPEFGQGIDVRHLCPNCVVLNVFFYSEFEEESIGRFLRISAHAEPCVANRGHVFPLARADEVTGFPLAFKGRLGTGLMPNWGLYILAQGWAIFFEITSEAPCSWDLNQQPDSPAALAEEAQLGPVSAFVAASLGPEALGVRPGAVLPPASGMDAQGLPGVLASTDFSAEGVMDLPEGAKGWFGFMEMRLSSKRPALQGFQQKIWMKSLMSERGVPIPRLLHTSEDSPRLPFEGPDLPRSERGYCAKPAHLAESHHTFAIAASGVNLLTGESPTLAEVQDNISLAWGRSLGDYDKTEGIGCAASGVHAEHIAGRACTNWALYNCPPGLIIEELAQSSPWYANFQTALLSKYPGGGAHEPPDEIKLHVVWGKVFVAEWVTPKLVLGYIFRHGFVKNTIIISPEYQQMCHGGERIDQGTNTIGVCNFGGWWQKVVDVAERAVPKGVDYLRVDIFPNDWEPVVNELSVAGYATLLEDWMLAEMMRRVQEGYRWRGARRSEPT
mmetsp:Transcript_167106/g.536692  ORF Transcript_167106/g.536692 Transcript_167106/m.536692 type:complete len:774 (-) Transcript_167106:24-2345(-)